MTNDDLLKDPRQFFTDDAQGRSAGKLMDTQACLTVALHNIHRLMLELRLARFANMRDTIRATQSAIRAAETHLEKAEAEILQYDRVTNSGGGG